MVYACRVIRSPAEVLDDNDDDDGDEGQVQERGQDATREGERRVLRTGKTASASAGHYQSAG